MFDTYPAIPQLIRADDGGRQQAIDRGIVIAATFGVARFHSEISRASSALRRSSASRLKIVRALSKLAICSSAIPIRLLITFPMSRACIFRIDRKRRLKSSTIFTQFLRMSACG